MKYENYTITRYDKRNLTVSKEVEKTAKKDYFDGEGNLTIAKGEKYMGPDELGYAQTPEGAFRLIVKDKSMDAMEAPSLCEALDRIENAVRGLKTVIAARTGGEI